ncbi:MAG: LacI family DNA-binding transcriptional regulator [Geminicoccaceae bacterium]
MTAPEPPAEGPRRRRTAARSRGAGVRIAEVAKIAGVSTATVSRALAAPDLVAEETRQRVLEAVRSSGYTPNLAARTLRVARSRLVLVVIPNIITPFFSELLLGVDRALSEGGYGMLIGNLHDRPKKVELLLDLVFSGAVDGVILLDGKILETAERTLAGSDVPMVAVGVPTGRDVPRVLVTEREASEEVARHLLRLGHRRFAYLAGPEGNYNDAQRWEGYCAGLASAGIAPASVMRLPGDFFGAAGLAAAAAIASCPAATRPTAMFAVSDEMAIAFLAGVRARGLRVPEDLSLVGFDGITFADYTTPMLTTVRQPREALGRSAVAMLLRSIDGATILPDERELRLEAQLRIGGSTGAAPPDAGRGGSRADTSRSTAGSATVSA